MSTVNRIITGGFKYKCTSFSLMFLIRSHKLSTRNLLLKMIHIFSRNPFCKCLNYPHTPVIFIYWVQLKISVLQCNFIRIHYTENQVLNSKEIQTFFEYNAILIIFKKLVDSMIYAQIYARVYSYIRKYIYTSTTIF